MRKQLLLIALFIALFTYASSILIEINRSKKLKYCFSKYVEISDLIEVSHLVSGEKEDLVDVYLYHNNQVIVHKQGHAQSEFKHNVTSGGDYQLCFIPYRDNVYYLSFEFFTHNEKGHTLNMAKDRKI